MASVSRGVTLPPRKGQRRDRSVATTLALVAIRVCQGDFYSLDDALEAGLDLVTPKSQDDPPVSSQTPKIMAIASSVSFNFLLPVGLELALPCRKPPAVPKIAIDEHYDSGRGKNEIGLAGQ